MGFINSIRRDIEAAPIVFMALGFGAGAMLYFNFRREPQLWDISLAMMLGMTGIGLRVQRYSLPVVFGTGWSDLMRSGAVILPALCAGFIYTTLHMRALDTRFIESSFYGAISGQVFYIDQSSSGNPRYHLRHVYDHKRERMIANTVRISSDHRYLEFYQPRVGDRMSVMAYMMPPSGPVEPEGFDFRQYAYANSISAIGIARSPVMVVDHHTPWIFQRMSDAIAAVFDRTLAPPHAAFAKAIFAGQRQDLPNSIIAAMRETNLAHLLAISGLHVGLIGGLVFFVVRNVANLVPALRYRVNTKKLGAFCVGLSLITYLLITGAPISTQRAVMMALVVLVAVMLDLRVMSMRTIAVAFLGVLILDPYAVTSVGFQMSFVATAALISVYQSGRFVQNGIRGYVVALILTTMIAGLATAPFVAYHFNMLSKLGFIANLFAVPIMGLLIMPLGLLALLEYALIGTTVAFVPFEYSIRALFYVGETAAHLQGTPLGISSPPSWVFGGVILSIIGCLCLTERPQQLSFVALLMMFAVWSQADRPLAIIHNGAIGYKPPHSELRAMYPPKGHGFTKRNWHQRDGDLQSPQTVVLNDVDPDDLTSFCRKISRANCRRLQSETGPFAIYPRSLITASQVIGDRLWVNTSE